MPFIDVQFSRPAGRSAPVSAAIAGILTDLTTEILHKRRELTAVTAREVAADDWFVGGSSLSVHGAAGYRVTIGVTAGTNTDEEKAAWIAAVAREMDRLLGNTRPESYVVVSEIPAQAWGWGGETQAARRRASDRF